LNSLCVCAPRDLIKKDQDKPDKDIIKTSGLSKGAFCKHKRILPNKGLI